MANDYSSFMEKAEDGSIKSFDENKLGSYIDSLVSKGVESYKAKAEKEQKMAQMTGEEQMAQLRKDFEAEKANWEANMKARQREFVVKQAKSRLADTFSETEIELLTKNVTDNEEESLKYIDSLVEERNKFNELTKQRLIEELQRKTPQARTSQTANTNGSSQKAFVEKSADEIKNKFRIK